MTRIFLLAFVVAGLSLFASGQQKKQGPPPVEGKPTVNADGLKIWEVKQGTGAEAVAGKNATVHYTGWLTDGKMFDSGDITFRLGAGQVIKGWDEGVERMKVGGQRRLEIPPSLGYGSRGAGGVIPPNATLIFDVELLKVQ